MKGVGNYSGLNGTNREASPRLQSQLSFSSRVPSSLGLLSQISEIGSESMEAGSPDSGKLSSVSVDSRFYSSHGFPYGSWNDSHLSENFSSMKREQENGNLFSNAQVICVSGVKLSITVDSSISNPSDCLNLERRTWKSGSCIIPPLEFAEDCNGNGCHGKVSPFPRFCSL
jgi:hypothetical protein